MTMNGLSGAADPVEVGCNPVCRRTERYPHPGRGEDTGTVNVQESGTVDRHCCIPEEAREDVEVGEAPRGSEMHSTAPGTRQRVQRGENDQS